jgi:NAD+ diphosphatase
MNLSNEHSFTPSFNPSNSLKESAWVIILFGKKILMRKSNDKYVIPSVIDVKCFILDYKEIEFIGQYGDYDCYCKRIDTLLELSDTLEFVELMDITKLTGDSGLFILVGTANHILHWNAVNKFCGCCGTKLISKIDERAKSCPSCNNIIYPRISPAVITAVLHEDKILLAHNRNFRSGMYSLIAGFVEPGESLEQCVEREIREEVGIKVKNIKYFHSQPWPFPDSLMLAFTAEYEGGDILTDNCEITDAAWYRADDLPDIPSADSIAGKMIRWFRDTNHQ